MTDERDREHDRPESDAENAGTGNKPTGATSTEDREAPENPETAKTDAVIEDRFEATDN